MNTALIIFRAAGLGGAPTISSTSGGGTYDEGSPFTLSVVATGSLLSYQWRKNGTPISGATGSSYTNSSAAPSDEANYSVVVTNPWGSVTSSSIYVGVALPPAAPSVSISGGGSYPLSYGDVTLTASVSGDGTIIVNWIEDGAVGPYPTGTTYTVSPPVTGFPGTPTTGTKTITAEANSEYGSDSTWVTVTWT